MKITKNSNKTFDYFKTIKKRNKAKSSQTHLSKDNIFSIKNQYSEKKINEPIFNENILIKGRLIKAAHLNPNINLTQIKNIKKKKKELKTEENDNQNEEKEPKIISVKKNNFTKIKILPTSKKNEKEKETDNNDSNINLDNNIKTFKYNYIKNK